MSEVTRLYDLPQVPMIKTVMSEVTRLYDLPQVLMITTVMSEVTRLYDLPQVTCNFRHDCFNHRYLG
jgi:hypothetical protein